MRNYMGILFGCAVLVAPALTCVAQNAPATAKKYTVADIKEYIRATEAELARRGSRERSLNEQIIMLDGDIESRVNSIMKALSTTRDSTDSRVRLMGMKKEAIEGLQKSLEYYGRERDKRSADLKANYSRVAKGDLTQDVGALNKRIDKRVEQIIDITKSFTEHKEFSNYNNSRNSHVLYAGNTSGHGHHQVDHGVKSRAESSNDRAHKDGLQEKSRLIEEMRAAMKTMERKNANLQSSLQWMTMANTKAAVEAELKRNNEVLAKRRKQLMELVGSSATATKTVSKDAVFEMEKLYADVASEIRKDFITMKRLVIERDNARVALKPWKDRLANAKAALEKEEAKAAQ